MANDINKETSVHFERLMKNVNTSVKIFSKNKENFNKTEVNQIIHTLFIAKSFERLADHSTNIAEITGFVRSI